MTMNAEELYSALDSIKTALTVNTKNVWDVADLAAYLKVSESRIRRDTKLPQTRPGLFPPRGDRGVAHRASANDYRCGCPKRSHAPSNRNT